MGDTQPARMSHDDPGKPRMAWNDQQASDALVDATSAAKSGRSGSRQSVPNSIAADSSAFSSSPSTPGLSVITSAPPTSSSPNSVPCSTST